MCLGVCACVFLYLSGSLSVFGSACVCVFVSIRELECVWERACACMWQKEIESEKVGKGKICDDP